MHGLCRREGSISPTPARPNKLNEMLPLPHDFGHALEPGLHVRPLGKHVMLGVGAVRVGGIQHGKLPEQSPYASAPKSF